MSKPEDLIEVLRCIGSAICNEAADAIEAQEREIEGLRKDAERYRAFIDCGQPICFLGEEYFGKDALDAAIDAAKGEPHG